jgi:hypothetical protein
MSGIGLEEHVAGRGAAHPWPPGELDVPVRVDSLSGAFIARWVAPFYLADPAALTPGEAAAWCDAARSADDEVIDTLLQDANWRPRVVGAWWVALRDSQSFEPRLGRLLLRSDVCFAGRAYAVALASLATPGAADWLERYLRHYLALPALHYDQAEAMAALQHLDAARAAGLRPAWDAFAATRSQDPLPHALQHVAAQLAALARLRRAVRGDEPLPPAPPAAHAGPALGLWLRLRVALWRFLLRGGRPR